jgi:flavodoxin
MSKVNILKILITYYSNTGNTQKVAESINDGLSGENIELISIKDLDPSILNSYDLVFLGSGVYASRVHKSILDLIKNAPKLPPKIVYFCTHASLKFYQKPFDKITKLLEKQDCSILGSFDCVGENLGMPKEKQIEMLNRLPLEQREKAKEEREKTIGRPNNEDLENAKEFAQSILKNI